LPKASGLAVDRCPWPIVASELQFEPGQSMHNQCYQAAESLNCIHAELKRFPWLKMHSRPPAVASPSEKAFRTTSPLSHARMKSALRGRLLRLPTSLVVVRSSTLAFHEGVRMCSALAVNGLEEPSTTARSKPRRPFRMPTQTQAHPKFCRQFVLGETWLWCVGSHPKPNSRPSSPVCLLLPPSAVPPP
jgi:hypothetical protein